MTDRTPKVSIGLAVFNGEKYLKEAIDSILAQTFTDFELIISDNASTDRTEEICREYLAQDKRIRYYRNPTNIGGVNNENRTFELSKGKYFRLAAHDDVLAPELLAKSVMVLDQDPGIVLCYSDIVIIDGLGKHLKIVNSTIGDNNEPYKRFYQLASDHHRCETTYALTRSDILRKSDLQLNYSDSDRTFLSELSLFGKFHKLPEPLFYKRYHSERSIEVYDDHYQRMSWFHPKLEGRLTYLCYFLYWRQLFHYLRVIHRAPINLKNRFLCYGYMIFWLKNHRKVLRIEAFLLITKIPLLFKQKPNHILSTN